MIAPNTTYMYTTHIPVHQNIHIIQYNTPSDMTFMVISIFHDITHRNTLVPIT